MVVWPQPAKLHVDRQQQHQKVVFILKGSTVTEQEHSLSALSFSAVSI